MLITERLGFALPSILKRLQDKYCYEDKGNIQIIGYFDANWVGCPIDRRSTTRYCVSIGGNVIPWKSKKQNTVAWSSAEGEHRAMATATLS